MKKGPEINFSKLRSGDVKVPPGLTGVYRELKGQHLLLIVALLLVALVAVPILIGAQKNGSDSKETAVAPIATGPPSKQADLEVSKWAPGILDYKKSLRGGHPLDPFGTTKSAESTASSEGSGTETESEGSTGGEIEAESPGSSGESSPTEVEIGGSSGSAESTPSSEPAPRDPGGKSTGESGSEGERNSEGSEGSDDDENPAELTADFQITAVHQDGGIERTPVRRGVTELTKLPNEAVPALTYVSPSKDGTKALMQVAPGVTAMIGDSKCVAHGNPCGLLALEVAAPETIVFGPKGLTYRIELVRIGDQGLAAAKRKARKSHPKTGETSGEGPHSRSIEPTNSVGNNQVAERVTRNSR